LQAYITNGNFREISCMKTRFVILCLVSFLFVSCSKEKGEIMIRIVNQSEKKVSDIHVFSFRYDGADVEKNYGAVSPGSATEYRQHEVAWNVPLLRFTMEGIGTIDITTARCGNGLQNLTAGNYSIIISDAGIYLEAD